VDAVSSADAPAPAPKPAIVRRLEARREDHKRRHPMVRGAFVIAGAAIFVAGVAMLALPGPGWAAIFVGLAVLSLEFSWAGNALDKALVQAEKARVRAENATRAQKLATAALVAGACAAIAAWALWGDIPLVPV